MMNKISCILCVIGAYGILIAFAPAVAGAIFLFQMASVFSGMVTEAAIRSRLEGNDKE